MEMPVNSIDLLIFLAEGIKMFKNEQEVNIWKY